MAKPLPRRQRDPVQEIINRRMWRDLLLVIVIGGSMIGFSVYLKLDPETQQRHRAEEAARVHRWNTVDGPKYWAEKEQQRVREKAERDIEYGRAVEAHKAELKRRAEAEAMGCSTTFYHDKECGVGAMLRRWGL